MWQLDFDSWDRSYADLLRIQVSVFIVVLVPVASIGCFSSSIGHPSGKGKDEKQAAAMFGRPDTPMRHYHRPIRQLAGFTK